MTFPGLPPQASAHAHEIDFVLGLEHWMMLALFVFFFGYFVLVLVRFRRGANATASYAGMRSYWSVYVVLSIALAEGVLLVAFEMPAWRDRMTNLPSSEEATVVRVVAEQFAWNVHYPGADGVFGRTRITLVNPDNPLGLDLNDPAAADDITTINRLNFPVGKPVLVQLSTKDVVHSFGLPQMRVKLDATPGMVQPVWFTPTATGEWDIACSQLCGLGHFRMRGRYASQTQADFDAWLAKERELLAR